MLKHDHEHVPYFPVKNCSRSSSAWYGSQFLNRTHCVVPRRNWTKLKRTHPAPQWIPTGVLWKDSTWPFSSIGHVLENHSKGPQHRTTIFSAIFRGVLDMTRMSSSTKLPLKLKWMHVEARSVLFSGLWQ